MGLEVELETFRKERPGWIEGGLTGKWVVIHGRDVAGFYDTLEEALETGYDRFGLDELFMARRIAEIDRPIHSSRKAVHVPCSP